MRCLLLRYLQLVTGVLAVALYTGPARADTEQEINQIEERRYETMAAADTQGLAQILADEFVYHQPTGNVASKAMYLQQIGSGKVKIKTFERYGVTVHVYGDTATAMGSTRLDIELDGQSRKVDLAYLNVWVKRDGRWQLAARQSAFKPAPK
jgi:ketosteroid isomerase-like protein